jgi:hypothetical protein
MQEPRRLEAAASVLDAPGVHGTSRTERTGAGDVGELPEEAYELIREAERRGYLRIDEENDRVTYNCARRHSAMMTVEELETAIQAGGTAVQSLAAEIDRITEEDRFEEEGDAEVEPEA